MFRTNTSPQIPQKTLQIRQDDKFFSRLLSKESSVVNPSFRVYYCGDSVTVPFVWESQPGTPKCTCCEDALPPLTPPPSYFSYSNKKPIKKHSRSSLLHMWFPRINLKKSSASSTLSPTPSSASRSSSSISSSFLASTPRKYHGRGSRFSIRGSSFDSRLGDEEPATIGSPNSALCFAISRRTDGSFRGCHAWW